MARALGLLVLLLLSLPPGARSVTPGPLVLLGGGARPEEVTERIVELAGGAQAWILILPFAHPEPAAAGADLTEELIRAGAGRVEVLALDPEAPDSWENRERINQATGIFLAGGDQARLVAALRGTELLDRIRALRQRGGVVAGTSAGATALGGAMVLGAADESRDPDRAVPTIRAGTVAVEPGLDFLPGTLIDQHFLARRRHNRLLTAALENPDLLAIGIDEATAIVVGSPDRFEVLGAGLVAIYDLSRARGIERDADGDLAAQGIALHLLRSGQAFDIARREVVR